MSMDRPLPKAVLKKLFLKTLHEHKRPNGKLRSNSSGRGNIIAGTLPDYFGISRLTPEEMRECLRGVYELERDGYLEKDPDQDQTGEFMVLTEKGLRVVEQSLGDMNLSSVSLDSLLSREDLLEKVRDDFLSGEYESAIIKAFKMVEVLARKKAGLTSADHGRDVFAKAFGSKSPTLKHRDAQTPAEVESLFFLMTGAYGWFRNPPSHRNVAYDDDQQAAQILGLANLLLDMIDQCSV